MGRTVSNKPGYAPEDEFDPRIDDFVSKKRDYLHFDLPLSKAERKTFRVSANDILRNPFWPLIGYTAEERRAKVDSGGNLTFQLIERPIKFGSHRDAAILQYYAASLSKDYENHLASKSFRNCLLAYRSGIGNNIDHAKSLFAEISSRRDCPAVAMDISGFFAHIRHEVLKGHRQEIKGSGVLPKFGLYLF